MLLTQQGGETSSFFLPPSHLHAHTSLRHSYAARRSHSLTPSHELRRQLRNFSCVSIRFHFSAAHTRVSEVQLSLRPQPAPARVCHAFLMKPPFCVWVCLWVCMCVCACAARRSSPLFPTVSEVIIVSLFWSRSISPHQGATLSRILIHNTARLKIFHTE